MFSTDAHSSTPTPVHVNAIKGGWGAPTHPPTPGCAGCLYLSVFDSSLSLISPAAASSNTDVLLRESPIQRKKMRCSLFAAVLCLSREKSGVCQFNGPSRGRKSLKSKAS